MTAFESQKVKHKTLKKSYYTIDTDQLTTVSYNDKIISTGVIYSLTSTHQPLPETIIIVFEILQ